jgi:hypothetical protein
LLGSAFIVAPTLIIVSIFGAVVLNLSIATNHKHGRYVAV